MGDILHCSDNYGDCLKHVGRGRLPSLGSPRARSSKVKNKTSCELRRKSKLSNLCLGPRFEASPKKSVGMAGLNGTKEQHNTPVACGSSKVGPL